jgi:hypothetical protein
MKNNQKDLIRKFIVDSLYSAVEQREDFADRCIALGVDPLDGMEFFEEQVERINKLFCYPDLRLGE